MQKKWLVTLLILIFLPLNGYANNFQHIKTWGLDLWDLSRDLEQAKWLAKRHDWVLGGNGNNIKLPEIVYDTMKAANPEVKFIAYGASWTAAAQPWIINWCKQNGYNYEDKFYHYYYDTTI